MSTQPGVYRNGEDGLFLALSPGSTPMSHGFFQFEFIKPQWQQVTHKPSGPTGQMEMEKGPTSTRDT